MNPKISRKLGLLLCCTGLLFLTSGCSSFEREWRQALVTRPAPNGLSGPWEGHWRSDVTGHQGPLRCVIVAQTNGSHSARFHAGYKKIITLHFEYTIPLTAKSTGGANHFQGEADLGWAAGGLYHYQGTATGTNFFSTYRCPADHGVFRMSRPPRPD